MSAYRDVFLSESAEYVQSIIDGLLTLESEPGDLEPVETVFRGAHSLKGMAAAMGYERTADLTHKMESLMDTVRKGEQAPDPDLIDLVLRATDAVKELIEAESSETEPPPTDGIVSELLARTEGQLPPAAETREEPAPSVLPEDAGTPEPADASPVWRVTVTLSKDCVLKSVRAYMVLKRLNYIGTVLGTEPDAQGIEDERFDRDFTVILQTTQGAEKIEDAAGHITDVEAVTIDRVESPSSPVAEDKAVEGAAKTAAAPKGPKLSDTQTVRVSISHLDKLVNLVGELVTVRSRLATIARAVGDERLVDTVEEIHRISGDLQDEVMQTRMVPVGNIFNRFPRMVRDLARDLEKDVSFEMSGLDIELDRTVLDEIGDPVVHLLRNAIDHGIEPPEARVAAGKPERGSIRLEAHRERDNVQIVVADDGRGMDADSIWRAAVAKGLCAEDGRETMAQEDILLLTCQPGFSTAEAATKVSGRGVGMDVVKGKIEYLGGSLVIRSTPGEGSAFVLTLPLTLAIIQALLVGSGEHTFAIPLGAVAEVVEPAEMQTDTVDGRPVLVLRDGSVVPIFRLDVMTGASPEGRTSPAAHEHVILLESGGYQRALAVQRLMGRQEIVIKPLSQVLKHIGGLSGTTVLGDGTIALILDPRTFTSMGEMTS
jgi:two-component system chemotaxis sensor kinase CheA